MKEFIESKWDSILDILMQHHDVAEHAARVFIRPLNIQSITDNDIIFYCAAGSRGIEFLKYRFYDVFLQSAIQEVTGINYNLIFVGPEDKNNKSQPDYNPSLLNLNANYTFDTFVVGPNNRMAHAVAEAVAKQPDRPNDNGNNYNPFFLYGGAGLGKTHLMHSIAHHIITTRPDLRVLYVTSETFTSELVTAIQNKTQQDFKDKYRKIDVLLLDDIQFIIGKEGTQNEFFHTFNDLYNSNKQIVISSDKHPNQMTILEDRMRTRFACGVTMDIQPPDYETKMAILEKQSERYRLDIPADVLQYVANNITSNIRELEGALNQICTYARLQNKKINLLLAQTALKDTIDGTTTLSLKSILGIVADHYSIEVDDILSKKRSKDIAYARQVCMYLCRTYTDYSLQAIGEALGNRDHTTVMHGTKLISDQLKIDDVLKNNIDILIKKLNISI